MSQERIKEQTKNYNEKAVVLAEAIREAKSVEQLAYNPAMTKLSKNDLLRALWNLHHRSTYRASDEELAAEDRNRDSGPAKNEPIPMPEEPQINPPKRAYLSGPVDLPVKSCQ